MRCLLKISLILTISSILFVSFFSLAQARIHNITSEYTYFPTGQSYINFDASILPLTFTTFYCDSSRRFHLNSTWIRSPLDLTVTSFYASDWFNYSVSGSGTQEIHTGVKPSNVYFDDVEQTEGVTWSYSLGTVTVTTSGTEVGFYFTGSLQYDRSASLSISLYPLEVLDYEPVYTAYSATNVDALIYGENFGLYFTTGETLGVHANIQRDREVVLEVTNGTLNANVTYLRVTPSSGRFRFNSTENFTFALSTDIANIKVNGVAVRSGSSFNVNENDVTLIEWVILLAPALPIKFILGIVGLVLVSGGSLYTTQKMKEKEYHEGIRNGAIFISLGVGLFLAWLF